MTCSKRCFASGEQAALRHCSDSCSHCCRCCCFVLSSCMLGFLCKAGCVALLWCLSISPHCPLTLANHVPWPLLPRCLAPASPTSGSHVPHAWSDDPDVGYPTSPKPGAYTPDVGYPASLLPPPPPRIPDVPTTTAVAAAHASNHTPAHAQPLPLQCCQHDVAQHTQSYEYQDHDQSRCEYQ